MPPPSTRSTPRRPTEWALVLTLWFVAIGALWGGSQLVIAPDGSRLRMPLGWLRDTPFMNYFVPGLILMIIVGGGHALIGWTVLRRWQRAWLFAGAAGVSLIIWIVVQMAMFHTTNRLQLTYLMFGVVECGMALMLKVLRGAE